MLINTNANGSRQAEIVFGVDKSRYDDVQRPAEHEGIYNKVCT